MLKLICCQCAAALKRCKVELTSETYYRISHFQLITLFYSSKLKYGSLEYDIEKITNIAQSTKLSYHYGL